MENYKKILENQLEELINMLDESEKRISKAKKLPAISVKVSKSNGCNQFRFYNQETKEYTFAKQHDYKKVAALIQREYDIEVNKRLQRLKSRLERFISNYDIEEINKAYVRMPVSKQKMITPIIATDEQYILKWLEEHPGMQNPFPDEGMMQTNKGEMVRSKSEKIIADALYRYGIPYQYEPLLELGHSTIYPDFAVLNVRTRRTLYWEHLGLVSDDEYAAKNFNKIQMYEKCGYLLGESLITTMESTTIPLDVNIVEQKIKTFLM